MVPQRVMAGNNLVTLTLLALAVMLLLGQGGQIGPQGGESSQINPKEKKKMVASPVAWARFSLTAPRPPASFAATALPANSAGRPDG